MVDSQTGTSSSGARPTTEKAKEKAREAAQQAQARARQATSQVQDRVKQQVDERSTRAGEQVQSLAQVVRKAGEEFSNQGNEAGGRIADQAATRLEGLGSYLTEADGDRIMADVQDFARRQPWLVAAGAGVLGVVAARFLKASSEQSQGRSSG